MVTPNVVVAYRKNDKSKSQNLVKDSSKKVRFNKKRGRPRKVSLGPPKTNQKIINKIMDAIYNRPGQPILYASSTKGTMKLLVDGHHFRYSFRKGKYSIFQCCYKENKEECFMRVVTDQKLVYLLDGEHTHFVQAKDKSATNVKISPLEGPEPEFLTITEAPNTESIEKNQQHVTLNMGDFIPKPIEIVKVENITAHDFKTELVTEDSATDNSKEVMTTEEFREKIKKRLQKALLGKKKH